MLKQLYDIIDRNCKEKYRIKLGHDGIMVTFRGEHEMYQKALKDAQKIMRDIEKENLKFERTRLQAAHNLCDYSRLQTALVMPSSKRYIQIFLLAF